VSSQNTSDTENCPLCQKNLEGGGEASADYPVLSRKCREGKNRQSRFFYGLFRHRRMRFRQPARMARRTVERGGIGVHTLRMWLGLLSFNKRVHLGWKLTAHAIAIPLLLVIINMFAPSAAVVSRVSWRFHIPCRLYHRIHHIDRLSGAQVETQAPGLSALSAFAVRVRFYPFILVLCGVAQPAFLASRRPRILC
jgi:hypothetical protein